MAQQQTKDTPTFGFRSIQLLKTQTLGIGSYGSVCRAKSDGLLCAAKIFHPTLYDPNAHQRIEHRREHRLPFRRFQQECEFMSAIRHPNIVQYLGTHQDPETGLPVLLLELMDDSLTHFLESSQDPVPYNTQVNFCHDITLAISFLHFNGIVHRDLSSNNVLLHRNVIAKVTDFGMAKLGDAHIQGTLTMVPGADVYMPPEAVKNPPIYTEKIDCFAIGALLIQILTRKYPDPADRLKTMHTTDPQFPGGTVEVRSPEIERRQNHITQVDPNHPILPIALNCLKDSDVERPSAQELCHRVAALKETPQYTENVQSVQERRPEQDNTQREEQIKELQHKDSIIKEKDEEIRQLRQQLAESKMSVKLLDTSQQNIKDLQQTENSATNCSEVSKDSFKFLQRECKNAPCSMSRGPNGVVVGDKMYVRVGDSKTIYAYNPTDDTWNKLPEGPPKLCSLAVVNNLVTTIGGEKSDQLFSLSEEGRNKKWNNVFPPMPTKRSSSTAVSNEQALIVAGGRNKDKGELTTVEIMEIATRQWSTAADLLEPLVSASVTICEDQIYMLGGWSAYKLLIKSVYTCSLTDLFLSCESRSLGERLVQSQSLTRQARSTVWSKVADLPVAGSTCVTLHGRLLVIGGRTNLLSNSFFGTTTQDIWIYNASNQWEIIGKIIVPRYCCYAGVLPNNEVIVVGGCTGITRWSKSDSVEIATVQIRSANNSTTTIIN